MKTRSLRFRLTLWYAILLFVGAVLMSAVFWTGVRYAVVAAADDRLNLRLDGMTKLVNEDMDEFPSLGVPSRSVTRADRDTPNPAVPNPNDRVEENGRKSPTPTDSVNEEGETRNEVIAEELADFAAATPEGRWIQVVSLDGEVIHRGESSATNPLGSGGDSPRDGLSTVELAGSSYRVLTARVSLLGLVHRVQLASSLESLAVIRSYLLRSLLISAPVALALCWTAGIWIAKRSLQPIDELSEHAARVTVDRLSERLPPPATGDGLERLVVSYNSMLERLEASVNRIEQFSADASHELRIPLSVIRTTAELALRHGRSTEEYAADLRDIHDEAERLTELVEVLLTLSRDGIESGESRVVMGPVDLAGLAHQVSARFQKATHDKGIALDVDSVGGLALVRGNEPALHRLVASLVENAIEHTSSGKVTIAVSGGASTSIAVGDTGKGIPPEALPHVFDRFYRVDPARSGSEQHFGLGLSIAKRIAALHGASITVSSELGEGSCFLVEFAASSSVLQTENPS